MTTKAAQETLSTMLIQQWEQTNEKIATMAEDFPESEYEFQPNDDVRSFGAVLRHLAFWNQYVADAVRGLEPDGAANELPLAGYSNNTQIAAALRGSAAEAATALREKAATDLKLAELCVTFLQHTSEHYGQLVVYYRLRGIVPPASRTEG